MGCVRCIKLFWRLPPDTIGIRGHPDFRRTTTCLSAEVRTCRLMLGVPPLQLDQHGPEQQVIGDASHESSYRSRSGKHRRAAALGGPSEPLSQSGVCVGGAVRAVTHLPFFVNQPLAFAFGMTAAWRWRRLGESFRLISEADHHAVGRPHGPLSAPSIPEPVPVAQAA